MVLSLVETNSDGGKIRRALTVGSVEQYKTEAQALKAAEGRRLIINDAAPSRPLVTFSALLDRLLIDQEQEVKAGHTPQWRSKSLNCGLPFLAKYTISPWSAVGVVSGMQAAILFADGKRGELVAVAGRSIEHGHVQ